jgi:hypothetical protein
MGLTAGAATSFIAASTRSLVYSRVQCGINAERFTGYRLECRQFPPMLFFQHFLRYRNKMRLEPVCPNVRASNEAF